MQLGKKGRGANGLFIRDFLKSRLTSPSSSSRAACIPTLYDYLACRFGINSPIRFLREGNTSATLGVLDPCFGSRLSTSKSSEGGHFLGGGGGEREGSHAHRHKGAPDKAPIGIEMIPYCILI